LLQNVIFQREKPPINWRFFFREIAFLIVPQGQELCIILFEPVWICIVHMPTQKVFLFWVTPLFYESICSLLKHPKIKLVGATSNYAAIPADVVQKKPDTILIEDTGQHHSEMIMKYLDTLPWAVKIILLGLADNKLVVYHHEQRSMVQTEDLLQLILSELR
jgi:hypothetical protein